jgi:hypothetical protein
LEGEEDRDTLMQIPGGLNTRWDDQAKRLITKLFCVASFKRDLSISLHILNFALLPPNFDGGPTNPTEDWVVMKREEDAAHLLRPLEEEEETIVFCQPCCLLMVASQYAIHMKNAAHRLPNGKPKLHDRQYREEIDSVINQINTAQAKKERAARASRVVA